MAETGFDFDADNGVGAGTDGVTDAVKAYAPAVWRTDAACLLLGIMLMVVPLYRTRILEDSFNTPKLALLIFIGVFACIALLARKPVDAGADIRRRYLVPWLMVGLAVWHAFTVLWADSKPLGVDGTVYFAVFAVLCWLFSRAAQGTRALVFLLNAGSVAAVATAGWVLLDDFSKGGGGIVARLPDWRGKLSAGLGNSGHIAGMVGMFLPWVVLNFLRLKDARRWWLLPVILLMFMALIVTWSVGSCGASLISLGLWGVVAGVSGGGRVLRWRRLAAVVAMGLMAMAFYFVPSPANPHKPNLWSEAFSSQRWEDGWPTRIVIWKTTGQIISQNPWVGAGAGNFTYQYTQQVVPSIMADPALRVYAGAFTNDSHNDFLQLWAEGGVVALGLWLGIILCFYGRVVALLRRGADETSWCVVIAAGAGFTVFVLDGLMSFPMRLPAHFLCAAFFLAVPAAVDRLGGGEVLLSGARRSVQARRMKWAGVGLLLTLAACMWHHGHRVMAEYHLKTGRGMADGSLMEMEGRMVPAWTLCDMLYQQSLQAVASGGEESAWRGMVGQLNAVANSGVFAGAKEQFLRAHESDKWYANASSRLGQLHLFQGDYDEALRVGRRTLRTLEAYEIHERMGMAAYLMGDAKTARDHWQTCLNRRPEAEEFYRGLLKRVEP